MYKEESLHGFDFGYDKVVDYEIDAIGLWQVKVVVFKGTINLSLYFMAFALEFGCQTAFVS